MRRILLLLLVVLCFGCNKQVKKEQEISEEAKGGKYYGGIFRVNESEYIKNLFPHNITDAYSYRVASQVYEGLFKFDIENLKVRNCLVKDYDVDESRTMYTFYLKDNVFFHDDPCFPDNKGRKLTAEDVAYCFTRLCTADPQNQSFNSIFKGILKGADDYYNKTSRGIAPEKSIEGIKVIDDHTIQLQLVKPNSIFLINLSRPACFIYPREAYETYGKEMRIKAVGTGPFKITDVQENISITLKRNNDYHASDEYGNRLPFLEAIKVTFINNKKTELFEFRKGNLDMVYRLPTEHIIEILEESNTDENGEFAGFQLQRVPEMVSQVLIFNTNNEVLKNKNVRKALNFAIDRRKILDFVLNGEGFAPGTHGITPPVFSDYPINDISGYDLNMDSARYYLSLAGYPNGKGFPELELILNAEGERNTFVAVEIQKELKDHLNIDLELTVMPFAQSIEKSYQGKYDLIKVAWFADFPSPENFLWLFYGKNVPLNENEISYPNIARFKNRLFDEYYEKALSSSSIEDANKWFKKAENELMEEAPLMVLWYDEGYRILNSAVRDFPNNPMQYRDFSSVYFSNPQVK